MQDACNCEFVIHISIIRLKFLDFWKCTVVTRRKIEAFSVTHLGDALSHGLLVDDVDELLPRLVRGGAPLRWLRRHVAVHAPVAVLRRRGRRRRCRGRGREGTHGGVRNRERRRRDEVGGDAGQPPLRGVAHG